MTQIIALEKKTAICINSFVSDRVFSKLKLQCRSLKLNAMNAIWSLVLNISDLLSHESVVKKKKKQKQKQKETKNQKETENCVWFKKVLITF